jgi:hypothetical protein
MNRTRITLAVVATFAAAMLAQSANAQYTLSGSSLRVGVGSDGSIINSADTSQTPDAFGQTWSVNPGIIWSPSGNGNFSVNNDFITPGTPFQMFSIGVGSNYAASSFINNADSGYFPGGWAPQLNGTTTQTGALSTLTTGSYGGLNYSQTLKVNGSLINFAMTLTNNTDAAISGVSFATGFDPDPDVYQYEATFSGDPYNTINQVISPGVVEATGPLTGNSIFIQDVSGGGVASVIAYWPQFDPTAGGALATGENDGNGDYSIFDDWQLGTVASGGSVTVDYNYIINATPVAVGGPVPTVPDGGATIALLGGALAGLGALKRRFAK